MTAIKKTEPRWPVVEIFGPTLQGEGVDQGVVCHFVRFGGCDYRCIWCDTPHAVLANEVRKSSKMEASEIVDRLMAQDNPAGGCAPWVILSGGNPALHDLQKLIDELHWANYLVAVETQGSRWREWMRDVDRLCVSPKPPSAREAKSTQTSLQKFLREGMEAKMSGDRPYEWMFLKIVIFDEGDLDFACLVRKQFSDALLYLSAGNDAGRTVGQPERDDPRTLDQARRDLLNKAAWLAGEVMKRPELCVPDVLVQHQLHVALWGNGQGF